MAVEAALEKITKRLDALDAKIATKEDIATVKDELRDLTNTFMKKVEQLEARVFEVEAKSDKHDKEVAAIKKKNEELQNVMRHQDLRIKQNDREINDLQQYSRRWNVRVYKVPEAEGETAEDCAKKVCNIFSKDVGVATSMTDIEVAHRAGRRNADRPRPILVRFFDRKKRDAVIGARKALKNKGLVIGEDLTAANYKLSNEAYKHSATLSVWSSNGKVLAKLKNGVVLRLNISMDLNDVFRRSMDSGNAGGGRGGGGSRRAFGSGESMEGTETD
jgi:ribosome-binding ATPase YchF (GTP1/OBG family)